MGNFKHCIKKSRYNEELIMRLILKKIKDVFRHYKLIRLDEHIVIT